MKKFLFYLLVFMTGFSMACSAGKVESGVQKGSQYDKPGYVTKIVDGRLWVFKKDSKELSKFESHGELAKHVIRPGAGPNKMTIKAPDRDTIVEYMGAKEGFVVQAVDNRLWVFIPNSKSLKKFREHGELAKHVIRPAAGPGRITLKAPDRETIEKYLAAK